MKNRFIPTWQYRLWLWLHPKKAKTLYKGNLGSIQGFTFRELSEDEKKVAALFAGDPRDIFHQEYIGQPNHPVSKEEKPSNMKYKIKEYGRGVIFDNTLPTPWHKKTYGKVKRGDKVFYRNYHRPIKAGISIADMVEEHSRKMQSAPFYMPLPPLRLASHRAPRPLLGSGNLKTARKK